jgi:hypothetical protein
MDVSNTGTSTRGAPTMRTYGYYLMSSHLIDQQLRSDGLSPADRREYGLDAGSPGSRAWILAALIAYAVLVVGLVLSTAVTGAIHPVA